MCHEFDHLDGHLYVEKVEGELRDVTYADADEEEEEISEETDETQTEVQMAPGRKHNESCFYGNAGFCGAVIECAA